MPPKNINKNIAKRIQTVSTSKYCAKPLQTPPIAFSSGFLNNLRLTFSAPVFGCSSLELVSSFVCSPPNSSGLPIILFT